jgi:hypothetical protein
MADILPGRAGALEKTHGGPLKRPLTPPGTSQPRYNALEQRFLVAPALASIFDTPNFSTFATVSAKSSLAYGDDPACRLRWITH